MMPRRKRAKRNPQRPKPRVQILKPKLNPMVKPSGLCPTGKLRYATSSDAELALEYAQANHALLGRARIEKRWYPKPGDKPCQCGGYHLTSMDPIPPKKGPAK